MDWRFGIFAVGLQMTITKVMSIKEAINAVISADFSP